VGAAGGGGRRRWSALPSTLLGSRSTSRYGTPRWSTAGWASAPGVGNGMDHGHSHEIADTGYFTCHLWRHSRPYQLMDRRPGWGSCGDACGWVQTAGQQAPSCRFSGEYHVAMPKALAAIRGPMRALASGSRDRITSRLGRDLIQGLGSMMEYRTLGACFRHDQ